MSRKRSYEGGGVEDNGGGMDLRRRILAWSLERERIETSLEREREDEAAVSSVRVRRHSTRACSNCVQVGGFKMTVVSFGSWNMFSGSTKLYRTG